MKLMMKMMLLSHLFLDVTSNVTCTTLLLGSLSPALVLRVCVCVEKKAFDRYYELNNKWQACKLHT